MTADVAGSEAGSGAKSAVGVGVGVGVGVAVGVGAAAGSTFGAASTVSATAVTASISMVCVSETSTTTSDSVPVSRVSLTSGVGASGAVDAAVSSVLSATHVGFPSASHEPLRMHWPLPSSMGLPFSDHQKARWAIESLSLWACIIVLLASNTIKHRVRNIVFPSDQSFIIKSNYSLLHARKN